MQPSARAIDAVRIGNKWVGEGYPCFIVAEIGINHNGDIDLARRLISVAAAAGCDAVKFQKRTVDVVYTPKELTKPSENPFGPTSGDLKRGLEFGYDDYRLIARYCREVKMPWFASCWDKGAVDFIDQFDPPCFKIASASLTDDNLLRHTRSKGRPIILSTGMSTIEEIDHAAEVLGREELVLLHACSAYPAHHPELNLRAIPALRSRYQVPVGYSGHETGLPSTVASVALGGCCIERHITLDRAMWGSEQAAALEPSGITKLVSDVRIVENSLGDGVKRVVAREQEVIKKLRPERLASDGQLMAYRRDGFPYAMDTNSDYRHLNDIRNTQAAAWKVAEDARARLPRLVSHR
jgi:N-acetylneuraminate synthase